MAVANPGPRAFINGGHGNNQYTPTRSVNEPFYANTHISSRLNAKVWRIALHFPRCSGHQNPLPLSFRAHVKKNELESPVMERLSEEEEEREMDGRPEQGGAS